MKKNLFYFALAGWILSLIFHLLTLFDFDVTDNVSFVWILNIGVFVVWVPTILELRKNQQLHEFQKTDIQTRVKSFKFFKIIFKHTPTGLVIIAIGGFFYAFVNFMLFITSQTGSPSIENGQYVLHNHGQLIKTLTEQEYHHYRANEIRGFSGHLLAFYGMAMAVLFPFKKSEKNDNV